MWDILWYFGTPETRRIYNYASIHKTTMILLLDEKVCASDLVWACLC